MIRWNDCAVTSRISEANTICSKAAEMELTRQGLALKAAIEQLREQVQNVE